MLIVFILQNDYNASVLNNQLLNEWRAIMETKKVIAYIIGGTCALAVLVGLVLLAASRTVHISVAIVIICLSVAFGIMAPNPISLIGLMAGICMIVFPSWIVGIIFICLGIAGTIVNLFVAKRKITI